MSVLSTTNSSGENCHVWENTTKQTCNLLEQLMQSVSVDELQWRPHRNFTHCCRQRRLRCRIANYFASQSSVEFFIIWANLWQQEVCCKLLQHDSVMEAQRVRGRINTCARCTSTLGTNVLSDQSFQRRRRWRSGDDEKNRAVWNAVVPTFAGNKSDAPGSWWFRSNCRGWRAAQNRAACRIMQSCLSERTGCEHVEIAAACVSAWYGHVTSIIDISTEILHHRSFATSGITHHIIPPPLVREELPSQQPTSGQLLMAVKVGLSVAVADTRRGQPVGRFVQSDVVGKQQLLKLSPAIVEHHRRQPDYLQCDILYRIW